MTRGATLAKTLPKLKFKCKKKKKKKKKKVWRFRTKQTGCHDHWMLKLVKTDSSTGYIIQCSVLRQSGDNAFN